MATKIDRTIRVDEEVARLVQREQDRLQEVWSSRGIHRWVTKNDAVRSLLGLKDRWDSED